MIICVIAIFNCKFILIYDFNLIIIDFNIYINYYLITLILLIIKHYRDYNFIISF